MKAYNPNTGEWESDPNLKPLFPTPSTEDKEKCVCGIEICLGGAEVEIGGVCHRPNNPCYIIERPTPSNPTGGGGGGRNPLEGWKPPENLSMTGNDGATPPTQGRMGGAGERVTLPTPPNPTNAGGNGFHKRNGEEVTHLTVPTPNPTSDTSLKAILESAKSIFKNPKLEVFEVPAPTSDSAGSDELQELREQFVQEWDEYDGETNDCYMTSADRRMMYQMLRNFQGRSNSVTRANVEPKRNTTPTVRSSSKELPSDSAVEELIEEFDRKFARINHIQRGECVISDASGKTFQVHTDETGNVTEIGGLETIKAYIRTALTLSTQRGAEKERERIKAKSQTHDASPDSAIGSEIWYHIKETDLNPPKEI